MHHSQHAQSYQQYHHTQSSKHHKKSSHNSNPSHSHSHSRSSSHKSTKTKTKSKSKITQNYYQHQQHKHNNNNTLNDDDLHSAHSDQKDDIKEDRNHRDHNRLTSHIGYASASTTISPQDSNISSNKSHNASNDNIMNNYNFTDATVKELSNNLGFEEEYVKMALVQSQGDITFAAEILFQMNEKTIKAIKKIEKQKRRKESQIPNFNAKLIQEILGMTVKELKKKWKILIDDKSKSELRSISRKQCINDDSDNDSDSDSDSSSSDNSNDNNVSFYKKNKKEIPTLCQCARNILFILELYSKWNLYKHKNKNVYFHVIIDSFLSHYSMIQLINDFQHIHIFHWDHCELYQEFENIIGLCPIDQCVNIKRHFRDREKYKLDVKRYKLYNIYINDNGKMNELKIKEIICKQWLDEIHCYLLHSLTKYEIDMSDSDDEDDEHDDHSRISRSRSKSASRASKNSAYMSRSQSPSASHTNNLMVPKGNNGNNKNKEKQDKYNENMRLLNERKYELVKYGFGRTYGRKNRENDEEKDENRYGYDVFKWQTTLNANSSIKPRFTCMREEILSNPYYKFSISEWNELYLKCEQISKSWIRKKIKAKDKYVGVIGYKNSSKNNKRKEMKLKFKKGDQITIEMIMAIKLYTDYDKLQYELKKCLRSNGKNDLSYLYWWRNMILIVVSKFGLKMKTNKFFYGLADKMQIERYCGLGLFNGPLSLTVSLEVAKMYTMNSNGDNGMLIQVGNAHPWIKGSDNGNGRYFDVSCVSDYKPEHEILTMLFNTRIYMVSLNEYIDTNINNISYEIFSFICCLFNKCIFSMNYELEYLLIQLITSQLEEINEHKYFKLFNKLCIEKYNLILWDVSYGLQDFFMVSTAYDDDFDDDSLTLRNDDDDSDCQNDEKLLVSFEKINELFINIKSLTLINHTLSNEVFYQFIDYLNKNKGNVSFEIVTFYFPKYKKLPHRLKINQLQHVWDKYLSQHNWHIIGYKYGSSLSPMIVVQKVSSKLKPFMGQIKNNHIQNALYHQFVKIEK